MGFLEAGTPMKWEDSKEYHQILDYVREHGVTQFLEVWNNVKDRQQDALLWGDEVEFHLFKEMDDGSLKLSLRAHELIERLNNEDKEIPEEERMCTWHPEYGSWMIEATPSKPYGGLHDDLRRIETNLRIRRKRILDSLKPNERLLAMPAWPLMGVGSFTDPPAPPGGPVSESNFLPDSCINPHPRFGTLTRNIRLRRGQKVNIQVPLFKDKNTTVCDRKYTVSSPDNCSKCESKEIYMDSMGFGMGCCCLQVTFQARDLEESTNLYDQLTMLCPIFLALTAGTPILKGLLADTDVRWSTISQSVDCRTPVERGVAKEPVTLEGAEVPQRGSMKIAKSRYDSVDSFLSGRERCKDKYNDNPTEVDERALERLIGSGVEPRLAQHIAHLFIRDPLVIFSERVLLDDHTTTEHFENIQSTNWQTMRWKPPPLNSNMGWRVEFRPMEIQLTDFENAAFTVIIGLLTRVIVGFDLNLYIPISKVDENMKKAHKKDALLTEKFWFRKNVVPLEEKCGPDDKPANGSEDDYELMTIAEILIGKGEDFPGLLPLVWAYLEISGVDSDTRKVIEDYVDLIEARATGKLPTFARWTRDFVTSHPDYKHDSVVSETIAHDLIRKAEAIGNGEIQEPSYLGKHTISQHNKGISEHDIALTANSDEMEMKKRRLRGASFHEDDVGKSSKYPYKCSLVLDLIEKHKHKGPSGWGHIVKPDALFSEAPAFLNVSGNKMDVEKQ